MDPQLLFPLLLIAVVAIPLVMGTRRQKKMAQEHNQLLSELQVGDRVMTTSGLYGEVADTSGDTTIDLEIAPGVVTTWLRQAIREKVNPELAEDTDSAAVPGDHEAIAETVEDRAGQGPQVAPALEEHNKK